MKLRLILWPREAESRRMSSDIFATHLIATDNVKRADKFTYEYNLATGEWDRIRSGMTPVFATAEDEARYERWKETLALEG